MEQSRFGKGFTRVLAQLKARFTPADIEKPKAVTATSAAAATSAEAPAQPEAVYQRITVAAAKQIIDSDPATVIVDVREPSEYATGHIPKAALLPLGKIARHVADVLPDTNARILVYCQSGMRSRSGTERLLALGYTNVFDIGGIGAWPYDVVRD
jgi:phage shock protein E